MKIEVKNNDPQKKYPWIGIDKDGDICIFVEEDKGLWVFMEKGNPTDIDLNDSGIEYPESDFEVFNGTVTFSND